MGNRPPNASCCLVLLAAASSAPACANGDTTDTPVGEDAGAYGNMGSGSLAASGSDNGSSGSVSAGSTSVGSASAGSTSAGGSSGALEGAGSLSGSFIVAAGSTEGDDAGTETGSGAATTGVDSSIGGGSMEGGAAPNNTGLSVLYEVDSANSSSPYLGCELSIMNAGTGSSAISTLKARYYFTDEVHLTEQMTINWSHVATSGANADTTVTSTFAPVVPAVKGADTYIEFGFSSGHSLLGPGESIMFAWQMQGPDPAKDLYIQSNDYSFDDSKKTLTAWSHVVLLQNGSVVWGTPP
jgi:hypothetical protein